MQYCFITGKTEAHRLAVYPDHSQHGNAWFFFSFHLDNRELWIRRKKIQIPCLLYPSQKAALPHVSQAHSANRQNKPWRQSVAPRLTGNHERECIPGGGGFLKLQGLFRPFLSISGNFKVSRKLLTFLRPSSTKGLSGSISFKKSSLDSTCWVSEVASPTTVCWAAADKRSISPYSLLKQTRGEIKSRGQPRRQVPVAWRIEIRGSDNRTLRRTMLHY